MVWNSKGEEGNLHEDGKANYAGPCTDDYTQWPLISSRLGSFTFKVIDIYVLIAILLSVLDLFLLLFFPPFFSYSLLLWFDDNF